METGLHSCTQATFRRAVRCAETRTWKAGLSLSGKCWACCRVLTDPLHCAGSAPHVLYRYMYHELVITVTVVCEKIHHGSQDTKYVHTLLSTGDAYTKTMLLFPGKWSPLLLTGWCSCYGSASWLVWLLQGGSSYHYGVHAVILVMVIATVGVGIKREGLINHNWLQPCDWSSFDWGYIQVAHGSADSKKSPTL